jgi:hypothetical protein
MQQIHAFFTRSVRDVLDNPPHSRAGEVAVHARRYERNVENSVLVGHAEREFDLLKVFISNEA